MAISANKMLYAARTYAQITGTTCLIIYLRQRIVQHRKSIQCWHLKATSIDIATALPLKSDDSTTFTKSDVDTAVFLKSDTSIT